MTQNLIQGFKEEEWQRRFKKFKFMHKFAMSMAHNKKG